jgi:hypothetical protein
MIEEKKYQQYIYRNVINYLKTDDNFSERSCSAIFKQHLTTSDH